ncbi:MAG: DUF998 domain-containing protein [Nitriliruptorales bacterium]|nr:DUF998 domain-containing protein [Nitriliruptorales bacterium]
MPAAKRMRMARSRRCSPRRILACGAFAVAASSVAALHVVRPDLAPVSRRLSEYANGPYSDLMLIAFTATGFGLLLLGRTVRREAAPWSTAASSLLIGAGLGMAVSGAFKTDPAGLGTRAEVVHSAASGLATFAIITAAGLRSVTPFLNRSGARRDVTAGALGMVSIGLGALSRPLHHTPWTGLSQRLLWLALMAWLLRTAWTVEALPRHPTGRPDGSARR